MHDHHLLSDKIPICPNCKKDQDGALGGKRAPQNGDYSICIYCASINRYSFKGKECILRIANEADFVDAHNDGIYVQLIVIKASVEQKIKARKNKL